MKKNAVKLSRAKRLMIVSIMIALTKQYDDINESLVFAFSNEKIGVTKQDVTISKSLILNFFDALKEYTIDSNESTILNFCQKSCDLLIAKTGGNDKIRGLQIVNNNIKEQLETIDKNETDYSYLLMNEMR